jgi:U1 small nuclear ribonucleoprotein
MPPREIREYACPLLQPPINRLFVPRPIPDYIKPHDRDPGERTGPKLGPVAAFMDALKTASLEEPVNEKLDPKIVKQKKVNLNIRLITIMFKLFVKMDEKKRALQEKIDAELANWNPKEYAGEEITSDPFKTIFVGGLSYFVTERQLKREFERFGAVKKVSIVHEKDSGKPRGYAFIEYEREKDVKSNPEIIT